VYLYELRLYLAMISITRWDPAQIRINVVRKLNQLNCQIVMCV